MTPKSALHEISEACIHIPGCYRSGGAIAYVRAASTIPDFLLPGRFIQNLPDELRKPLRALTSSQANDIAPWYLKQFI